MMSNRRRLGDVRDRIYPGPNRRRSYPDKAGRRPGHRVGRKQDVRARSSASFRWRLANAVLAAPDNSPDSSPRSPPVGAPRITALLAAVQDSCHPRVGWSLRPTNNFNAHHTFAVVKRQRAVGAHLAGQTNTIDGCRADHGILGGMKAVTQHGQTRRLRQDPPTEMDVRNAIERTTVSASFSCAIG